MRTERVTFVTAPDQKAARDAFAANNGQSVGHVLREPLANARDRVSRLGGVIEGAAMVTRQRRLKG